MAIPIERINQPIKVEGPYFETPLVTLPGTHITTAYASGDALGTQFEIEVPQSGSIQTIHVTDMSAATGIALDILLFDAPITQTTDDAAMDMADADRAKYKGVLKVAASEYAAMADNCVATTPNVGVAYAAPRGKLICQCVSRGTHTLVALTDLAVKLVIIPATFEK